jgi:hypothetical protein
MAGIYQRDNRQALLANALQNALNRREAAVARDEQRRKENFKALGDTMKAFGRAYESYGMEDEEKLKQLEAERAEVVAAQQEHDQELRDQRAEYMSGPSESARIADIMRQYDEDVKQRKAVNDYILKMNRSESYANAMNGYQNPSTVNQMAMAGYRPTSSMGNYMSILDEERRRRGY